MGWLPEPELGLQADACNRGAAVSRPLREADAIGEQQSKRTQYRSRSGAAVGAAAEADAIGEQQLCTESCPAPDYSRR